MPRYFFHFHDGGSYRDDVGHECDGDADIRRQAMAALPAIAMDEIPKDGDKQGYMVLVTDEEGTPIYSAALSYAGVWLRS